MTPAGDSINTLQDASDGLRSAVQDLNLEGATKFHNEALIKLIRRVDSDLDDLKAAQEDLEEKLDSGDVEEEEDEEDEDEDEEDDYQHDDMKSDT